MTKDNSKNMQVETSVMARLVEVKKVLGLKTLSHAISYLLDHQEPVEQEFIATRAQLLKEYRAALDACQKLRELVSQPTCCAYGGQVPSN